MNYQLTHDLRIFIFVYIRDNHPNIDKNIEETVTIA